VKAFIVLCCVSISLIFATSTTSKIKSSQKNLSETTSAKKKTSRKLDKIAKDIKFTQKEIVYLEKKIADLEANQEKMQKQHEVLKTELKQSQEELAQTETELNSKAQRFISLLSEQFSIVFAMEHSHEPTQNSIISHEVYSTYKKQNAQMLDVLKKEIIALKKSKKRKEKQRNNRQVEIEEIIKKRESFALKKQEKEKLRKKLSVDEEKYNAKLEKIEDKQNSLRATLAKLNILHDKEVEEARKRAAARKEAMRLEKERQRKMREEKALARAKSKKAKELLKKATTEEEKKEARLAAKEADVVQKRVYKESKKVRQVNSSYKKSKTYAYRGKKTISPLSSAKVVKKFGTYIDPIYKIKIFNESVTLKSKTKNAKVKNVLNGKVVFADNSSMLGNVVVVLHSNKIHTVYAGLSKIAPTIRVGKKIKKGYVVGKVNEKLIFQATKNSKHINPLRLIKI